MIYRAPGTRPQTARRSDGPLWLHQGQAAWRIAAGIPGTGIAAAQRSQPDLLPLLHRPREYTGIRVGFAQFPIPSAAWSLPGWEWKKRWEQAHRKRPFHRSHKAG